MHRKPIFSKVSEPLRLQFRVAWGYAPHPQKVWKGGQDAIYVSKSVLVVADGVGGWTKHGVDSGVYSRKLISTIKQLMKEGDTAHYIANPRQLAVQAVEKVKLQGSATLAVLTLDSATGLIRTYHVGDSVYGLFRTGHHPFIAAEQQKKFNVPYQVSAPQNQPQDDSVDECEPDVLLGITHEIPWTDLADGWLVVATDGLWDNVHVAQIALELQNPGDGLQKTRNLVQLVKKRVQEKEFDSPFYLKACEQGVTVPRKAKIDDVSIILAQVVHSQEQQE